MALRRDYLSFRSGPFTLAAVADLPGDSQSLSAIAPVKRPGVLFCHGFTGNRFETRRLFVRMASRLAARGIGSFRFDHRGCGESEGDFGDFTPRGMLEDARNALRAMQSQTWIDRERIAIVGFSLGGAVASYLAQYYPQASAVVLWSPVAETVRVRNLVLQSQDPYSPDVDTVDFGGFRVCREFLDEIGHHDPVACLQSYPQSVFILHGEDDVVVPPEQAKLYISARNNPNDKLVLLPHADHGYTTAANGDLIVNRTEEWLANRLLEKGST